MAAPTFEIGDVGLFLSDAQNVRTKILPDGGFELIFRAFTGSIVMKTMPKTPLKADLVQQTGKS
jgi:hypothetical protein